MSEFRLALGERFKVKGFYGDEVETNNTFIFAQSYEIFASELKESGLELFNCTEGGMHLNGFTHCSLEEFLKEMPIYQREKTLDVFSKVTQSANKDEPDKKTMRQYVSKNMSLGNEIATFIDGAIEIIRKGDYSDHKITR